MVQSSFLQWILPLIATILLIIGIVLLIIGLARNKKILIIVGSSGFFVSLILVAFIFGRSISKMITIAQKQAKQQQTLNQNNDNYDFEYNYSVNDTIINDSTFNFFQKIGLAEYISINQDICGEYRNFGLFFSKNSQENGLQIQNFSIEKNRSNALYNRVLIDFRFTKNVQENVMIKLYNKNHQIIYQQAYQINGNENHQSWQSFYPTYAIDFCEIAYISLELTKIQYA